MNYPALAAEIVLPAYVGLDDAAIASGLMAEITEAVDVPTEDARRVLLGTGEWGALCVAADVATDASLRGACIVARDTLLHTSRIMAADADRVSALLSVLVTAGIVAAGTRNALLALGHYTTTRAAQLGFGGADADTLAGHVAAARRV